MGCNAEVKNHDGDTALQIMLKRQRLGCVMALLSRSADAASVGSDGNNALHLAINVSILYYFAITFHFVVDSVLNVCRFC